MTNNSKTETIVLIISEILIPLLGYAAFVYCGLVTINGGAALTALCVALFTAAHVLGLQAVCKAINASGLKQKGDTAYAWVVRFGLAYMVVLPTIIVQSAGLLAATYITAGECWRTLIGGFLVFMSAAAVEIVADRFLPQPAPAEAPDGDGKKESK